MLSREFDWPIRVLDLPETRRRRRSALDEVLEACAIEPVPENEGVSVELVPGGFAYRGNPHNLTGRPRGMLAALLASRHRRCGVVELLGALEVQDEYVEYPEQVIKDAAKDLRAALRRAASAAGVSCENPLPSKGKGEDLAYVLELT